MTNTYNGHKNRNHWNVSLWINNDEGLYHMAKVAIKNTNNRQMAADYFLDAIGEKQTPDGVKYTKTTIRAAMVGM